VERDVSSPSWLAEPGAAGPVLTDGERSDVLLAGLARRICGHAERQLSVAERLDPAQGAELAAGARRLLRDGESVLTMVGGAPERRGQVPTGVGRILADTAAGADEPARVAVPPAPSAALAVGSAVGAGQVLAELLAHAERAVPRNARIEIVGRWAGDGGITIELQGEGVEVPWQQAAALENEIAGGASGPIPPERLSLHLAARLARRCGARVELQTPLGGPSTPGFGTLALVRFPRALVEPVGGQPPAAPPAVPAPRDTLRDNPPRDPTWEPVRAGSAPAPASIDELFGPWDPGRGRSGEDLAGTPIFAAVASAWFSTEEPGSNGANGTNGHTNGHANGWSVNGANGSHAAPGSNGHGFSGDAEWQAAAQRASALEEDLPVTGSGLPQRRPGRQMVTPPLRSRAAKPEVSAEREPERVRNRLSTYQRGLEAGRHRAADPEDEPSFQTDPAPEGPLPGPTLERMTETRDPWTGEGLWDR
jgi:hypothetical protein